MRQDGLADFGVVEEFIGRGGLEVLIERCFGVLLCDLESLVVYDDSDGSGWEEAVGVEFSVGDGFDDEPGFEEDGFFIGVGPGAEGAISFGAAEEEVDGACDHGVVPGEEGDVFAGEGAGAVERGYEAMVGEGGEGVGGDAAGVEFIGLGCEFFGMDAVVFEDIEHEGFEEFVSVFAADILDEALGGMGAEGVEFEEAVASLLQFGLEGFAGFLGLLDELGSFVGGFGRGQVGCFHGEVMDVATELAEEFITAFEVGFDGVEAFVVPSGESFLWAAGGEGEVDMDGLGLADAVESTDALLEDFGVEWEVEEDEVVGELEVTSFAADF